MSHHQSQQSSPAQIQNLADQPPSSTIPYSFLLFNPHKHPQRLLHHCKVVFDAVFLIQKLQPTIQNILDSKLQAKQLELPAASQQKAHLRTLCIDIDQTLVKPYWKDLPEGCEKLTLAQGVVGFQVRPHALEFLRNMRNNYELVLFTSGQPQYSKAIFNYFNQRTGGALSAQISREHCTLVYKSWYIKDLRVIKNRSLKDIVLLDNSVLSFGNNLGHGVPISTYNGETDDRELLFVQNYLTELSQAEDLSEYNRQHLKLEEITTLKAIY